MKKKQLYFYKKSRFLLIKFCTILQAGIYTYYVDFCIYLYFHKINIRKKLEEGDIELSKWTLERLDDDYKNKQKQEITGNINGINPITINVIPVKSENEL